MAKWGGGAERGEMAGEGLPGLCGAGHARRAGRDGEGQLLQGRVMLVGGGGWPDQTVRRCPGMGQSFKNLFLWQSRRRF